MKIFVDDIRKPSDITAWSLDPLHKIHPIYKEEEWIIVRTYKDFCNVLRVRPEEVTHVSLDHQLAENTDLRSSVDIAKWFDIEGNYEYTGSDCALYLKNFYERRKLMMPTIYIHTNDVEGIKKIKNVFT